MFEADSVAGLVMRARGGDEPAWDELVDRFLPLVSAIVARHRLRAADADDVNQTVWLRLVEHLGDLQEPRALPGWIATTTRRECLRALERSRRTVAVDPQAPTSPFEGPRGGGEVDEDLLALERQECLRRALRELPPERQQLLLLLAADPPLPYQEIGRRLGMPVGSIGPTRARALEQLRRTDALRDFETRIPVQQRRTP